MASPVDTSVKFFTEDMPGAPVLNGQAGSLIGLLDALLVTGFGLKSATSLVVADGIATLAFSGGASAAFPQSVIEVAGATGAWTDLNGPQKVLAAGSAAVTFATDLADGTATGTITFKMAPLGWTKVFTATNKAVYKPSAVEHSGALLRVDDSGATSARLRMYESMSDIDTGVNPAPPDSRISGGYWWHKSSAANSTPIRWTLVGDSRNFYYVPVPYTASSATMNTGPVYHFGDLKSLKSGDAYCGCLTGSPRVPDSTPDGSVGQVATNGSAHVMRPPTGLGNGVPVDIRPFTGASSGVSGNDSSFGPFPAPVNNGLLLVSVMAAQNPITSFGPRGFFAGVSWVPQTGLNGGQFARGALVPGTGEFTGKSLFAVPAGNAIASTNYDYPVFMDITGPWRG